MLKHLNRTLFLDQTIEPHVLAIEPCTFCQLRCPNCPNTGSETLKVGRGVLLFDDFKTLIDENPSIAIVRFSCFGELFLNKELLPMIEYISARGGIVHLSCSNFNNIRDGVLEGLVRCGVRSLAVALDGASAETYATYRRGGDFNGVIENVRELNRFKQLHGSPYPELSWQYVVFGHNEHEIEIARELAEQLDMHFRPKLAWDSDYSPIQNPERVKQLLGLTAATREEFVDAEGCEYMRSTCAQLWKSPRVNWDGKILGCCWTQQGFGGNAFRDGYIKAINNEKIRYARGMLLGMAKPRADIACTNCRLYMNLTDTKRFLTPREIGERGIFYRTARFAYRTLGFKWAKNRLFPTGAP